MWSELSSNKGRAGRKLHGGIPITAHYVIRVKKIAHSFMYLCRLFCSILPGDLYRKRYLIRVRNIIKPTAALINHTS